MLWNIQWFEIVWNKVVIMRYSYIIRNIVTVVLNKKIKSKLQLWYIQWVSVVWNKVVIMKDEFAIVRFSYITKNKVATV